MQDTDLINVCKCYLKHIVILNIERNGRQLNL
jgi:hypothetical protein